MTGQPGTQRKRRTTIAGKSTSSDFVDIFSDGASRGNPGPAGIGAVARDASGREVLRLSEYLGETTNNAAEYHALVTALEKLSGTGYRKIRINSDSELLIRQISGCFKVKSKRLMPLVKRVRELLAGYESVELKHIKRDENTECDRLANLAIEEGLSGSRKPVLPGGEASLF